MSEDYEEISQAEFLVGLLTKTASSKGRGVVFPITVRFSPHDLSMVRAMAKHSDLSVNKMVVELVSCGLESALKNLPRKDVRELRSLQNEMIVDLLDGGSEAEAGDL